MIHNECTIFVIVICYFMDEFSSSLITVMERKANESNDNCDLYNRPSVTYLFSSLKQLTVQMYGFTHAIFSI